MPPPTHPYDPAADLAGILLALVPTVLALLGSNNRARGVIRFFRALLNMTQEKEPHKTPNGNGNHHSSSIWETAFDTQSERIGTESKRIDNLVDQVGDLSDDLKQFRLDMKRELKEQVSKFFETARERDDGWWRQFKDLKLSILAEHDQREKQNQATNTRLDTHEGSIEKLNVQSSSNGDMLARILEILEKDKAA
jgi:hypothetical protein